MEHSQLALSLILIGAGLVLLVAELFVPSGGILTAVAIGVIIIGVGIPFFYGDTQTGILTLIGVFVAVPTVVFLMMRIGPKTPLGKMMIKGGPDDDATVATMPVNVELEQLRGQFGRAVSSLRPSGVVDFNGRRIDTITEGMMVEPGTWVRCIDVKAGKVVVRPMERPPDVSDLEKADFT
jgi:membrane-bound serine protease (ClpP class)